MNSHLFLRVNPWRGGRGRKNRMAAATSQAKAVERWLRPSQWKGTKWRWLFIKMDRQPPLFSQP
jgi:hypothetical protein